MTTTCFLTLESEGVKHDAEKIDPSFVLEYFPRALLAIAAVSEYGARKYTRGDWRNVDNGIARYGAALVRHQLAPHIEGPYDGLDSGLSHLAQQAWNTLAVLEKAIELGAIEIRRGNDIVGGKPILGSSKKIG
jgi:hypothetical protein